MKRIVLAALVCGIVSFSAFAAAPHPTAIDADGDGTYVATVDVNGDGKKDHDDIGVSSKVYDCDDKFATVSPLLTEIVADGIDNDCSSGSPVNHTTGDLTFPVSVSASELARWKANWLIPWTDVGFVTSYDRLVASSHVTVVELANGETAGTYTVADGYQVGDWITGELPADREFSAVRIRPDGALDIFTDSEVEYVGRAAAAASRPSGLGRTSVTKIADESATAATGVLREEMLRADSELDGRVDSLETTSEALVEVVNIHTGAITDLEAGLAAQDDRIEAETARAQAAEAEALRVARSAQSDAYEASRQSDEALSHGTIVEGYGLGGIVTGSPTTRGERNSFGGGAGAGFNVGADLPTARVNVFCDLLVGYDGSDLMHSESVGLESTFKLGTSDLHLGPSVAYTSRFSQDNLLESAVVGRGPLVGLTLAAPFAQNGAGHGLFQVRADCGPEWVGVKGATVGEGVGLGCRATIGVGGGVGAPR